MEHLAGAALIDDLKIGAWVIDHQHSPCSRIVPMAVKPALDPHADFALVHHALAAVRRALYTVLRIVAVDRKQADHRVAAAGEAIEASAGEIFHRSTDPEFVF
jgi:hypothetical protein